MDKSILVKKICVLCDHRDNTAFGTACTLKIKPYDCTEEYACEKFELLEFLKPIEE